MTDALQSSVLKVVGLQVGQARKVLMAGRSILTAISKAAVTSPMPVGPLGLAGDEQADLSVHGGLDKAVYAYPSEHYAFWQQQRQDAGVAPMDNTLAFGALGENLSLRGLLERDVWVGDLLRFTHCTLRVTQPREPCFKFNTAMGLKHASQVMARTGWCGFYLAVDLPGTLEAGEAFELVPGPRRMGIPERFQATMFKHMR